MAHFPKKETWINPIIPRGELASFVDKTELCSLSPCPFCAIFSGIGRVCRSTVAGVFAVFIVCILVALHLEWVSKTMLI